MLVFNGYQKATKGLIASILALSLLLTGCRDSIQSALPPAATDVIPQSTVTSPTAPIADPLPEVLPVSAVPNLESTTPAPQTVSGSLPLPVQEAPVLATPVLEPPVLATPVLDSSASVAEQPNSVSTPDAPMPETEASDVQAVALPSDLPVAVPVPEPTAAVIAPLTVESQDDLTPPVAPPTVTLPMATAPASDTPILETPPAAIPMAEPVAKTLDLGDERTIDDPVAPASPVQS